MGTNFWIFLAFLAANFISQLMATKLPYDPLNDREGNIQFSFILHQATYLITQIYRILNFSQGWWSGLVRQLFVLTSINREEDAVQG